MRRKLITLTMAAVLVVALGGCVAPPWEMRTYVGPANPAGVYTDITGSATWQYNMSKVRGRWVCPVCGYSCDAVPADNTNPTQPAMPAPYCPEPWVDHPDQRLVYQPVERCFLASTDRKIRRPDGELDFAIIGKPFHPRTPATTPDETRSAVHVAVAGLLNNPNVVDGGVPDAFVRFLFVMPGATMPAARVLDMAAGDDEIGVGNDGVFVNPWRVTDGEVYHVQLYQNWGYLWNDNNGNGQVDDNEYQISERHIVVRAYSSLDGLVLFSYNREVFAPPRNPRAEQCQFDETRFLTDTGAVRVVIPEINPPTAAELNQQPGGPQPVGSYVPTPKVTTFTIRSNAQIIPGPTEHNVADPSDWTEVPADWPWDGDTNDPPSAGWELKKNYFVIPADGRVADWLTNVEGSGTPVQNPYIIPPGAVGKGWVVALWQWADAPTITTNGMPYDATTNPYGFHIGTRAGDQWIWHEQAEWNYDWLTEDGNAAAYQDLWSNNRTVADGVGAARNLVNKHTPDDPQGSFKSTDPPPFIACSFMSSRIQVPPTGAPGGQGYEWFKGAGTAQPVEVDSDPNSGHAVIVVGEVAGATVTGSYEPGTRTVTRYAKFRNRQTKIVKCPGCGSAVVGTPPPSQCPYCETALTLDRQIDGYASTFVDIFEPPGTDIINPRSGLADHVAIPDSCLEAGPHGGWYGAATLDSNFWIAFDLPKYLPPSVPAGANPAVNDLANDPGYRGRLVLFHRPVGAEQAEEFPVYPRRQSNWRWDARYRCPACGSWQDEGASWDFTTGQSCAKTNCAGTKMCPLCAIAYPNTYTGNCKFCGDSLADWNNASDFCSLRRVTPADINAEEYDVFEVIVSVLRKLELGSKVAGLDLGRVAPGVNPWRPDTTVGSLGAGAPKPEPSEVSPEAQTAVMNEGNVAAATTIRGTNLNRAGVDPEGISRPAEATRSPVTVGTLRARDVGDKTVGDASPLRVPTQEIGGAEGYPAASFMTAGWSLSGAYKPVPLGQPAGTHAGTALFFQDLDGDGALDFYDVSAGIVTDTSSAVFDQTLDLPLEPVTGFDVRLRVAETGLPDNDYFAADFWPTMVFGYDSNWKADKLQYVVGSNRPLPPNANVGDECPPNAGPDTNIEQRAYNLFYGSAGLITSPGDPTYRGYAWRTDAGGNLDSVRVLTNQSATGVVNSAPTMTDTRLLNNAWLALWHRVVPTATGWESTLRYNTTASGDYTGSNEGFMFSGRYVAGLRSLVTNNEIWLFWHTGQPGQEQIEYLPGFDPRNPTTGQPLPVSNSFGSQPHRERAPVSLSKYHTGATWPTVSAHKPALSPFVYTKDPCAWTQIEFHANPQNPEELVQDFVLNVAFTGYTRHEQNADICWVKYRYGLMGDAAANYGKKAFPRLEGRLEIPGTGVRVGEELQTDVRRQVFASQHLDWVVHDNSDSDNFGRAPDPSREDPRIYVAVVTDVYNDDNPPDVSVYEVTWSHTDNRWSRARNAYLVEPVFQLIRGADVLASRKMPSDPAGAYRLVDPPTAPQPNPQPLMLEINIAAGRLRFSSPLFNTEAPGDRSCVVYTGSDPGSVSDAVDVRVYADYTPMVWRVTRDPADDDSAWVYSTTWSSDASGSPTIYCHGYLAFFWRRSFGPGAPTPLANTTAFMYKLWAPSAQVLRYPYTGNVQYWDGSGWADLPANYVGFPDTGVIVDRAMSVASRPRWLRLRYTDDTGTERQEGHAFPGWTRERQVPVETELCVGPFTVRPELYMASDGSTSSPAIKFWLIWTSPRALLDLRDPAAGGGGIRQSADVYLATVIPELNNSVAEPIVCSIPSDKT
jgi:hypothetical protein